ncbi:MAG TPA: hypothetical protein VL633_06180, partial [Bacteroidota bacterium]|nr:hypothetical protein [Bacteroidota bacterium]
MLAQTAQPPSSADAISRMLMYQAGPGKSGFHSLPKGALADSIIQVTDDGQSEWSPNIASDPYNSFTVLAAFQEPFLAGSGNGFAYSHDGGLTWQHSGTGIPIPQEFTWGDGPGLAFDSHHNAYYMFHAYSPGPVPFFRSNNGV